MCFVGVVARSAMKTLWFCCLSRKECIRTKVCLKRQASFDFPNIRYNKIFYVVFASNIITTQVFGCCCLCKANDKQPDVFVNAFLLKLRCKSIMLFVYHKNVIVLIVTVKHKQNHKVVLFFARLI